MPLTQAGCQRVKHTFTESPSDEQIDEYFNYRFYFIILSLGWANQNGLITRLFHFPFGTKPKEG